MIIRLDLSDEGNPNLDQDEPVTAEVLAVLMHEDGRLYAVAAEVGGAPWFGLVPQDSSALLEVI